VLDPIDLNWFLSGISLSVPLIFAALGGLLSERSGVINIALEGMMLFGAFIGVAATWWTGSPWFGILAALLFGAIAGTVHAWFSITVRANQIVSATAINLVAAGLTAALVPTIWGVSGTSEAVESFGSVRVPLLSELPWVGTVFETLTVFDYLALAAAPVLWVVLYRSAFGLRLRSCGESPTAAASVGVKVLRVRYQAVILSGVLASLGGVYLSLVELERFQRNMTNGRGFLALAALIFGKWKPVPVVGACLLFGMADSYQLRAQTQGLDLPTELLQALPYLIGLAALATVVGRASAPAAIGETYVKD
jgi:simple sugar transport system permease protein